MRVRFTPSAKEQLLSAVDFIAEDNPTAALRFHGRALRVLRRLRMFPNSGRRLPEFPHSPHREIVVPPYRFFYRVEASTVWVVAVWHGARIPREPEADEA